MFLGAAAALGPLCLALAPVALAILFGYSLTKRFTALCHLFLGLAIAGGPAGAWIAVRGDFGWTPGLLMLAVGCWIAGFDILYALADRDFDRAAGLHSIPARLGVTGSLIVSALLHAVTVAALFALAPISGSASRTSWGSLWSPRCSSRSTRSCAQTISPASTSRFST